ncbi:MAG: hypothetical protein KME16_19385 [Scytolyngbya sp. HA4215-MV1]|nr:hypothetical protein [Scytolyngbya sp. HA4215-MV1]
MALLSLLSVGLSHPSLAQTPISANTALLQEAGLLRNQGPEGLQAFLTHHARELANRTLPPSAEVRTALDKLCQQKDCYASRLYWYTDLEQAKAAAKASGKPILSLRLLGRLDQDLSCANSRFFRVALYPNAAVSKELRDHFILHWQSVRPVPTVTIDFGDGRKLQRTLTGNSIHYVLDANGRPIDALPGLYGPQAFLQQLRQAEQLAKNLSQGTEAEQSAQLQQYHRDRLAALQTQWSKDLSELGISSLPKLVELPAKLDRPPTAEEASRIAISKMVVENPILISFRFAATENQKALESITDQATWGKLAERYAKDARLDVNSLALIQAKKFASSPATAATVSAEAMQPLTQKFEAMMALDTVRNEYLLHSQLHQWFVQASATRNVDVLNERVYAQLFLTPSSDPWLGLASEDIYSAIDNDGIR